MCISWAIIIYLMSAAVSSRITALSPMSSSPDLFFRSGPFCPFRARKTHRKASLLHVYNSVGLGVRLELFCSPAKSRCICLLLRTALLLAAGPSLSRHRRGGRRVRGARHWGAGSGLLWAYVIMRHARRVHDRGLGRCSRGALVRVEADTERQRDRDRE